MNKPHNHIMVCVTMQRTCERLIRQAAEFSLTLGGCPVSVLHVTGGQSQFLGIQNQASALEYLYQVSKEYGADMTVERTDDVISALADFARKNRITHVVLGGPVARGSWDVPALLSEKLPGVEMFVIPSDTAAAQTGQLSTSE